MSSCRPRDSGSRSRIPISHRRSLVARETRLGSVPGIPEIRLHLAAETGSVWRSTETALGTTDGPIPFWAFAWAGGLALARYVLDHPDEVAGRTALDLATGSGLVAIAAAKAGAASVVGVDIDPFAEAAFGLNARANRVRLDFVGYDLLDEPPPEIDVVLAADAWYEGPLAERVSPWLRQAERQGSRVLIGDPGRRYFAADGLVPLATYEVETTTQLEDRAVVASRVYAMAATIAEP